jgi:hypothetical protein
MGLIVTQRLVHGPVSSVTCPYTRKCFVARDARSINVATSVDHVVDATGREPSNQDLRLLRRDMGLGATINHYADVFYPPAGAVHRDSVSSTHTNTMPSDTDEQLSHMGEDHASQITE